MLERVGKGPNPHDESGDFTKPPENNFNVFSLCISRGISPEQVLSPQNIPVYNGFIARGWVRPDTKVADVIKKAYAVAKKESLLAENPELIFHLEAVLNMHKMREQDKKKHGGNITEYATLLKTHNLEGLLVNPVFSQERGFVLKNEGLVKDVRNII